MRVSIAQPLRGFVLYGEPEDVEGQCNARLSIADDMGDNTAGMRCQLESGHEGPHREVYDRQVSSYTHDDGSVEALSEASGTVVVTWHGCDREEREAWDAKYCEEYGPYCEKCHANHHGECQPTFSAEIASVVDRPEIVLDEE